MSFTGCAQVQDARRAYSERVRVCSAESEGLWVRGGLGAVVVGGFSLFVLIRCVSAEMRIGRRTRQRLYRVAYTRSKCASVALLQWWWRAFNVEICGAQAGASHLQRDATWQRCHCGERCGADVECDTSATAGQRAPHGMLFAPSDCSMCG